MRGHMWGKKINEEGLRKEEGSDKKGKGRIERQTLVYECVNMFTCNGEHKTVVMFRVWSSEPEHRSNLVFKL